MDKKLSKEQALNKIEELKGYINIVIDQI